MRAVFVVVLAAAACSSDPTPTPKPATRTGSDAATVLVAPPPDAPTPCAAALAAWSVPSGTFGRRGADEPRAAAKSFLAAPEVFAQCSDAELGRALELSMSLLTTGGVLLDLSGSDGPVILVRHGAVDILRRLSGRDFGMPHAAFPNQPGGGGPRMGAATTLAAEERESLVLDQWRAWWAIASHDPPSVLTGGKRAAAGEALPPFEFEPKLAGEFAARRAKLVELEALAEKDPTRLDLAREAAKKAEHMRGVKLPKRCLDNPLAVGC